MTLLISVTKNVQRTIIMDKKKVATIHIGIFKLCRG